MNKILLLLLIVGLVVGYIVVRYRKELSAIYSFYKEIQKLRGNTVKEKIIQEKASRNMVNCANCGRWTPENAAISRAGQFYCGVECTTAAIKRT